MNDLHTLSVEENYLWVTISGFALYVSTENIEPGTYPISVTVTDDDSKQTGTVLSDTLTFDIIVLEVSVVQNGTLFSYFEID